VVGMRSTKGTPRSFAVPARLGTKGFFAPGIPTLLHTAVVPAADLIFPHFPETRALPMGSEAFANHEKERCIL